MKPVLCREYRTARGTQFAMSEPPAAGTAPLLLLFASTASDTLTALPYGRLGHILAKMGWNVVSMDLPCHGEDRRADESVELAGWAERTRRGEDFVSAFQLRVNDVIDHLIRNGMAGRERIVAAGTSRGGFMAFHAAAANQHIRAVLGFAPVTDLLVLREFAGLQDNALARRLALANLANRLADRAIWIMIGDADERVGTGHATAFAQALADTAARRGLPDRVVLKVVPVPGHVSFVEWHDQAAAWIEQVTGL